jgi:hypothetical protein
MNDRVRLIAVFPSASEHEVAAISVALGAVWPTLEKRQRSRPDDIWRLSGRTWQRTDAYR